MKKLALILLSTVVSLPLCARGPIVVSRQKADTGSRASLERVFRNLEENRIDQCNWPGLYPYTPEVSFKVFHTGGELCIRYEVSEYLTVALEQKRGGDVCMDSCVEFFISPDGDMTFYNYEFSCIGMPNIEHNSIDRHFCHKAGDRTYDSVITYPSMGRKPFEEKLGANRWSIIVVIPIGALFDDSYTSWNELERARVNFYSCGDRLSLRHLLSWSPVGTPRPQFHAPDYFEQIIFE